MSKTGTTSLKHLWLASSMLAASGLVGAHATAQETADSKDDTPVAVMDQIIVTATKREQTLQDTPVAVTVTSADTIDKAKIIDIVDLQTVVPSLRISNATRTSNSSFAIRGFGNGGNSVGGEPAVGLFIDGVFRSRTSASILDLPLVERVEVLSGPQSTLFGKNASAGVVSIISQKPSFEHSGRVEATLGNYNQYILKGHVTGPISDKVAGTISGSYNKRDGFTESLVGLSDLNDRNRYSVRGDLLFEPSENTSWRLIADYSKLDEICCTVGNVVNGPTAGAIVALGGQILSDTDPFAYESVLNTDPENKIEDYGASLHVDHDFGGVTFSSITAYRSNMLGPRTGDIDYTSLDLAQGVGSTLEFDTLTQEFRLASDNDSRLNWMLGAYFFQEDIEENSNTQYGADLRRYVDALTGGTITTIETLAGAPAGSYFGSGLVISTRFTQDNSAYSVFGTADFDLTDRLTLTGGLNYTNDQKDVTIASTSNPDAFSALDLTTFFGGVFAPLRGVQFRAPLLACPNVVESCQSDDDEVTWLARASWEANDNLNFYATAATGFKGTSWASGDFAQPSRDLQPALEAAGIAAPDQRYLSRNSAPENSTVYELGMKANFSNGYLNVAVFDQNIENFQTRGFDGVAFISTNAGKYSAQGVEFDLLYRPTPNWTLTLAGTYLDPIYDDFQNAPGPAGAAARVIDRSGTRPGGIHPFSGVATTTYNHEFSNGVRGYVRGEYLYESSTELTDAYPQFEREVKTVNASAGLAFDNNLSLQLWVRNLTNDEYLTGGFNGVAQGGTINSFYNAPRTWGGSIAYEF